MVGMPHYVSAVVPIDSISDVYEVGALWILLLVLQDRGEVDCPCPTSVFSTVVNSESESESES